MPRSPSRDRSDRYAGNRAYFHEPDWLRLWKVRAIVFGLALAGAWVLVELTFPSQAATFHTHGELIDPHAAWDSDCAACHVGHDSSHFFHNPISVFQTRDRWHDLTCEKCHAGPKHHGSINEAGQAPYSGMASPTVILPSAEAEATLASLRAEREPLERALAADSPAYDAGFEAWLKAPRRTGTFPSTEAWRPSWSPGR